MYRRNLQMYPVYGYGAADPMTPDNVWPDAPTPATSVLEPRYFEEYSYGNPDLDPEDEELLPDSGKESQDVAPQQERENEDATEEAEEEEGQVEGDEEEEDEDDIFGDDEEDEDDDWDYIEESTWFGTFFLFYVMLASNEGLWKEGEEKAKPTAPLTDARQIVNGAQESVDRATHRSGGKRQALRRVGSASYPLVDLFLLFTATWIQPLLYGFFLWGIIHNLKSVDMGVTSTMCPYPGTWQGNPIEPAKTQENCMYCGLLWLYILQLVAEMQNTREFMRMSDKDHPNMNTLARHSIWFIFVDQLLHVGGLCMLITVSMIAMFYQKGVGSMVLNATAIYCLEQIDDQFKAVLIKRQKEHLVSYIEKMKTTNQEEAFYYHDGWFSKLTRFLQVTTILLCTAIIGFTLFLFIQTLRNCKPSVDINLYGNV